MAIFFHQSSRGSDCTVVESCPYENLQPDTARIQPDSGQKAFFTARMERDKARHEICLALQRERDICLATVRAGIWLDLNVTGRD